MIVSNLKLLAIVGFSIAGAAILVPEKSELMTRVIEDGDMSRALELIGEKPDARAFDEIVEEFSRTSSPTLFKEMTVLISLSDDPNKALDSIMGIGSKFRLHQKRKICELFARRGLELNQLSTSLKSYQWLAESVPLNDKELNQAITISRYASRPDAAIGFIHEHRSKESKDYKDLPDELRNLLVVLNREVNNGGEALSFLTKELDLAGDSWEKWDILEKIVTVSLQANQFKTVLPLLESHISTVEAGTLSGEELLKREKPHRTDEKFLRFGKIIGQNYEWSSNAVKAFPYYYKLAILGDQYSMERCFALYDWAQQHEPMMNLLANTPVSKLSYEQLMKYAKLEASLARFDRSRKLYEAALDYPEADLSFIYRHKGLVVLQLGNLSDALSDFEKSLRYDPNNSILLDQIASIHAAQGRHHKAMETYSRVPIENHTKAGLENYKLLADSLESDYDQLRIARHLLKSTDIKSSNTYLEISQIFQKHVYDREAFAALDIGLNLFPDSKKLKLAKIDLLIDNETFETAFEEVKASFDKDDLRFHQRVITIAESVKDSRPMLKFLNLEDKYAKDWDTGLRLELASVYEKMEKFSEALEIWSSYDPETINLKRLNAKIAYQKRRYKEAVALQEQYIRESRDPDAYEWQFLGDVYLMTNRSAESQRAYTVALEKIHNRFTHRL